MLVEGIRIFWVGLQRTNNMRRYTASSPISKRYTYTPVATARPCSSPGQAVFAGLARVGGQYAHHPLAGQVVDGQAGLLAHQGDRHWRR